MIYVSFHALYASDSLDVVVTLPAAGNVETGSGCVVMGHMEWTRTFTLNTNASLEQSQRPCKPRIIEVTKCDGETNTVTDDTMHCSSLGSTRFLVSVYTCGVLLIYINYMQQSRAGLIPSLTNFPLQSRSLLHTPSITVSTRRARWPLGTPGLAAAAIRARIHHLPPMTARLPAWLSVSGLIIIFSLMMYLKQSEWMLSLWKLPVTSWQVRFVAKQL